MQFKPLLAFISLSQLLSLASAAPAAELEARQFDPDSFKNKWLELHNNERTTRQLDSLEWDGDLAWKAQQVATQCNVDNPQLWGDNGASFNIGRYTKEQAFAEWTATSGSFPDDRSIPWQRIVANSAQKVGCGEATCVLEGDMAYTVNVCYYDPPLSDYYTNAGDNVRVPSLALLNLDLTTPFCNLPVNGSNDLDIRE
uniref:Pathogenesis-related protein 1 n=3 Tax=Moniliophthora perniciosa TaxID=153609 RepID=A0A8E6Y8H2_MONPR|nr:pathogenesis-related protein 1 [Moniliophthora perniciosa]QVT77576.1 pathogenesis-related protein 1 [Moniliophthora perniciosa]QVT77579.1 pathogenesis-related protein 1 [Moniliophthora perniciosa]